MKKISILIDITASNDLKVVEEILNHLKTSFNKNDDINVVFYPPNTETSSKQFWDLEYPLEKNITNKKLFGGNLHEVNVIKEELTKNIDKLIMISDFYDIPLSTDDILTNTGEITQSDLLFIGTMNSLEVVHMFVKNLQDLPNIQTTNLSKMKIEEEKLFLNSKIKCHRNESHDNKKFLKV